MSVSAYSLLRGAVAPLAARSANEPTGRARASSVRLGTPTCRCAQTVLRQVGRTLCSRRDFCSYSDSPYTTPDAASCVTQNA